MSEEKIAPHKVTKPIQLLAAWLVGLCVIDGTFLAASATFSAGWIQSFLVIASVINVPLFILAIFLLQTKFRPEMQEDSYYAKYIDKKTNQYVEVSGKDKSNLRLERIEAEVRALNNILTLPAPKNQDSEKVHKSFRQSEFPLGIAINDHLPWFSDLRNELRKKSFPVNEIFGAVNKTEPPKKFIASFGKHLSADAAKDLLNVLFKFPFDGISVFDLANEPEPQDVFIGAYGYEKSYAPFTPDLQKMVEAGMEQVDFEHYIKLNRVKLPNDRNKKNA